MKDNIRVAIIQPKPYPAFEDPRNIGHAILQMEKLRNEELDVICFPEYFPYHGEKELAASARQYKAYLIAGLVEAEGDHLYNTATLFDPTGRILGRQRKRNVGALERNQLGISPGDGVFRTFPTDFGKIGLPVCIDFWGQPEAAKQITNQGADIIFNIGIFPVLRGHWRTGSLVRAFDNFMPVVGVNTADYNALIDGRRVHQHGGHSMIIQPPKMLDKEDFRRWLRGADTIEEWVTLELDELEQASVAEINLSTARRFRQEFWNRFGFQRVKSGKL
jgi:predicted amidohydrolase